MSKSLLLPVETVVQLLVSRPTASAALHYKPTGREHALHPLLRQLEMLRAAAPAVARLVELAGQERALGGRCWRCLKALFVDKAASVLASTRRSPTGRKRTCGSGHLSFDKRTFKNPDKRKEGLSKVFNLRQNGHNNRFTFSTFPYVL